MIYHTVHCALCECEIKTYIKKIGSRKSAMETTVSDDGVYYYDGWVWFCNSCWDAIWKSEKLANRKVFK